MIIDPLEYCGPQDWRLGFAPTSRDRFARQDECGDSAKLDRAPKEETSPDAINPQNYAQWLTAGSGCW